MERNIKVSQNKKYSPLRHSIKLKSKIETNEIPIEKVEFIFEESNQMKIRDLDLKKNIVCNPCGNYFADRKLDDICSFLPKVQRESDLFHKKFCELMNYIETNIEEKS